MDSPSSQSGRSKPDPIRPIISSSLTKTFSDVNTQSLSSILNNPHKPDPSSWSNWWPTSSTSLPPPEFSPLLPSSTKPGSDLTRSDLLPYLTSVSPHFTRFEDIRNHSTKETLDLVGLGGSGEALVACLREVPALYFKEDFKLEDGPTFRAACPFATVAENLVLQEKLSQYLDVVELHLVKEISLRSSSFFEAQVQLEDLNGKIVEGCGRIRELKETIRVVDADLVDLAREIRGLNCERSDLIGLQNKLRLILYVNQALSALKLLVASADCAGALDVTDDLQHLLDGDELTGLHCFRHLRDHVAVSIDSINSILSAEFTRASLHDTGDMDAAILSKSKARASGPMNGTDDEVKVDDEETSNFRDRLLPLIIGLLRTAKLPNVLRSYRDTLTADMKSAIKTAVLELLPVLLARSLESDFTAAERIADTDGGVTPSKLRSLSSESFVQLLVAIFKIVQAHLVRASEVKKAIEWIMCNLDGHYAADSVAAAIALGAAATNTAQDNDVQDGSFLSYSPQKIASKVNSIQGKGIEAASPSKLSRNFRADVLRENTEAVFAACDIAHGRWAKLLGVRALLHPRLKLQEFLSMYSITQEFITATEKIGGRLGYSIRGTLQSQAKAFVDHQHETRMAKIKAVLDQETWAEVDVPDEFQDILISLFYSEPLVTGDRDDTGHNATGYSEMLSSNDGSPTADTGLSNSQHHIERTESIERFPDSTAQAKSSPLSGPTDNHKDDVTSLAKNNNINTKELGKSSSQTISFRGVGYHMVNCGLILVKMLSEYIDMNNFLPVLSSEIVHRVVEILKFFNTRTCQLVLGAGAMQVSGLKSITAKHLALASQVVSFIYAIIPELRRVLFLKVPDIRKGLLLSEMDRLALDYKVHRDEIHTKLVQIMRERLLIHLRGLPQIVEGWNRPEDTDLQPSQFARSLTKEVGFLQRILSRTLHEVDVQEIFRQVVIIFHSQISETFLQLEISTPQAKNRLYRDIQHILGCIRSLPSGNLSKSGTPNWGKLDELLVQRFGTDAGQ